MPRVSSKTKGILALGFILLWAFFFIASSDIGQGIGDFINFQSVGWERILTRLWLALTVIAIFGATIVLALRKPETTMQRASLGLLSSYSMMMMRIIWTAYLCNCEGIPQPWAMIFWLVQAILALYFVYAMLREWAWPGVVRIGRKFGMKITGFLSLILAIMLMGGVARAQSTTDEQTPAAGSVTTGATSVLVVAGQEIELQMGGESVRVVVLDASSNASGDFVTYTVIATLPDGSVTALTPCDDVAVRCLPVTSPAHGALAEAQPTDELTLGSGN